MNTTSPEELKLKEIRAHHARADNPGSTWTDLRVSQELETAHADRAALLTLLDALRAQVEEMREAEWRSVEELPEEVRAVNPPMLGDWINKIQYDYKGDCWVVRFDNSTKRLLGGWKVPRYEA